jgi:DNA-binding response OmpR family regulator
MDKQNYFSQVDAIVIDDDNDIVAVFTEYLEMHGINGKDAIDLYRRFKPDVVFLDVMMPEYNGLYGLERIKQYDSNAKIIMTTAHMTKETEDMLNTLGADRIIFKPFTVEALLVAVNTIIKSGVVNN